MEPTPGAGPCIEELAGDLLDRSSVEEAIRVLERLEYTVVDLLLEPLLEGAFMYLRVAVDMECLRVLEMRVRSCGGGSARLLRMAGEPEVSRVIMEADCLEIVVPVDPLYRVKSAMNKLGVRGSLSITMFRPAE